MSVQWNYGVKIGLQKESLPGETRWAELPAYIFEGNISLPALPPKGMKISMPDAGPQGAEIVDVYVDVDGEGRFGYRMIVSSSLAFVESTIDDLVTSLESILSVDFNMLRTCGFHLPSHGLFDRQTLFVIVEDNFKQS
ncbi:MAG: hypothetical protein WCP09_00265 [Candidatus Taylorbacteria bacterium]